MFLCERVAQSDLTGLQLCLCWLGIGDLWWFECAHGLSSEFAGDIVQGVSSWMLRRQCLLSLTRRIFFYFFQHDQ